MFGRKSQCQLDKMNRTSLTVGFVKSVYWAARLAGLCPFHRDVTTQTFKATPLEIIYSLFVWLSFICFYFTSGLLQLVALTPLLFSIYMVMEITTITFIYFNHTMRCHQIAQFATDTVELFRNLKRFHNIIGNIPFARSIVLLITKIFLIGAVTYMTTIKFCIRFSTQATGGVLYRAVIAAPLSIFILKTVANIYYIYILISSLYFKIINDDIENAMQRSKYLMNTSHSDAELGRLLRQLNQFAQSLRRLCENVRRFNEIFSSQLLVMYSQILGNPLIEVMQLIEALQ